jgi:ribonucleoside-triphosphate reductase
MATETTEYNIFVRTSDDVILDWDRTRIAEALIRETQLDSPIAHDIAKEVEQMLIRSGTKTVTSPLVRELVNAKLIERGLEEARARHTRLGMPLWDVENLMVHPNKENANVPHGPEATNLTLAERIKKEYALLEVFSPDVADGHMKGDIHLHDLGFIDRPYCSGQSLEYIKKFGLDLPHSLSMAKPARRPEVLIAHLIKFAAALQSYFAGAIGWDAVNVFFAPFLSGMRDDDIRQLTQMLIYEFSQQAVARGGQAIFSDINLYWEIPEHFAKTPAIGPGGAYTGKTYGDYRKESQRFAWQLFEVYKEGDGSGRPFSFPKPLVHITEKFFRTDGHEDFLRHLGEVSSEKGNPYYVFDRGETAKISECCRLSFKLDAKDLLEAKEPWRMRYSALQNVTLNLPRLAYLAKGDEATLFTLLTERFSLAVKAHQQKRAFMEKLLSYGEQGPLSLLTMKRDGAPYLRLDRATHLVGMVGLNELVQQHTGEELHVSKRALRFGLKVIAHLKLLTEKVQKETGLRIVLEQTPAESTSYRFARLDYQQFFPASARIVKGDIPSGEIYYTNSTHLNVGVPINPIERVISEGCFHPLIEAGSLSHVWIGESRPAKEGIADFVVKTFRNTTNDQITFSPEFTTCNACNRTSRGLSETCPFCASGDVDGITRITGYFTRLSSWNKGKLGELRDRYRNNFNGGAHEKGLDLYEQHLSALPRS